MKRAILSLLILALVLAALPVNALAANALIHMGGKVGFMYEDMAVTLKPKLWNVSRNQLTWTSSDTGVAWVADGTITALNPGRTIITASGNGAIAQCGVVVLPREIEVQAGETVSLPYGTVERYAVQNSGIAAVSAKGVVTGVSAGSTLLRVSYGKQVLYVKVNVTGGNADMQSKAAYLACAGETEQIVLVEHQGGSYAKLSIHEKLGGFWKEIYSCGAYLGRNGIGKTREGDGKTPTGTFNLTQPFGIKSNPGAKMNYTQVTKYHYWCGSSDSKYYNQMVDTRVVNRACTSSDEYLINYGSVYNYCMFIDYNAAGVAGKGSCIFLHCKGGKDSTAGCISVEEGVMKKIIQWARPGAKIVIC